MVDAEWTNPVSETEEKKRLQQEDDIRKIFNEFFKQFTPAASLTDSDLQISSGELFNQIVEHYPSEVLSQHFIYEMMLESGYRFECLPLKVEFVWLLKRKSANVLS